MTAFSSTEVSQDIRQTHPGKAPFDKASARTVYVLIRTDLTPAQQGVQACHAAMQAVAEFGGLTRETRLALLSVPDGQALQDWQYRLLEKNIPATTFWEPDNHTGESALATAPLDSRQGKAFSRLPLWSAATAPMQA